MHFTPTSASWLNMVERFFRDITTDRLRRGVFTSVSELEAAIQEYVAHHNKDPKPFIWTKSARDILQKVVLANSKLSSKQNGTLHYGMKLVLTRFHGHMRALGFRPEWGGVWGDYRQCMPAQRVRSSR